MTPPIRVVGRAHAKINLDLRILAVRADGYHELRTVFQTIAMHDTLVCEARPGPFQIQCSAPGVPADRSNLVWAAASRLWAAMGRTGEPRDVVISIDKRIPVQAGLGGGSADAAAALRCLGRMWGNAAAGVLSEVGTALGADVAFFLTGGTALGLGRGDEIHPMADLPPMSVVIVQPGFGVSTAEAYGWYDADRAKGLPSTDEGHAVSLPAVSEDHRWRNDLEAPVVRRHPRIAAVRDLLRESGADAAAMSGSGSAVFGLFRTEEAASSAVRAVSGTAARAFLTRTLSRGEHDRSTTLGPGERDGLVDRASDP